MAKTENTGVKYFEDQMDDEEVLYVFRRHPIVMRKGIVLWAVAMLIGPFYTVIISYLRPDDILSMGFFLLSLMASFLLSLIVMFPFWLAWHYSVFIVTDQRFIQITQKGFFHRSVVDVGLNQIQMVNYEVAGLQETLMGFGTIMMQTYMGELLIHEVHHPAHIQKKMLKILRDRGIIANSSGFKAATDNQ